MTGAIRYFLNFFFGLLCNILMIFMLTSVWSISFNCLCSIRDRFGNSPFSTPPARDNFGEETKIILSGCLNFSTVLFKDFSRKSSRSITLIKSNFFNFHFIFTGLFISFMENECLKSMKDISFNSISKDQYRRSIEVACVFLLIYNFRYFIFSFPI